MDISGVSIPTSPDVYQEPPRDAELESAVQEASQADPQNNASSGSDSQDTGSQSKKDEGLGRIVDERA